MITRSRLVAALAAILIGTIPGAALAQSDAPSPPAEPVSAALPAAFAWEPVALPKRKVDALPALVIGALPGERTLIRAYQVTSDSDRFLRATGLWTSTDLATWKPGKDGGTWFGGPARGLLLGMTRPKATNWLAAGDGVHVMAFDGELRTSADGTRWKPVSFSKKLDKLFWDVVGVARTADGFLSVGQFLDKDADAGGQLYPAQMSSMDGLTWVVSPIGAGPGSVTLGPVVGADGTVIAIGSTGTGDDATPVVWVRSPEGTWASLPAPWAGPAGMVTQLGHAAGRFFLQVWIVETVDGKSILELATLTSPDGVTWEPGPTTGQRDLSRIAMAVGAVEGGVLVVLRPEEPGPVSARWSPDWMTWSESTIPGIDERYFEPVLGRLHDGRAVVVTVDPDTRTKKGTPLIEAFAATPIP